jgi:hypothetical protein
MANGRGPGNPNWTKGVSGNPDGRMPGSKNKRTLLEEQLAQAAPAVQGVVINTALGGDMQAASLVMARVAPPLRAQAPRVQFDFDPDAPLEEQSKAILAAVSNGEMDMDTAKGFMDLLACHVGMKDVQTFLSELKRLRESKSTTIPGGVDESAAT